MTKTMTQPQMAEFDARELALYQEMWKIEATLPAALNLVHQHAGDTLNSNGYGRPKTWGMSDREARGRIEFLASSGNYPQDSRNRLTPSALMAHIEEIEWGIERRRLAISAMEDEFARLGGWNRYFPCRNRDGHIHASLRGCPTVRWDTDMGWATEMSGLTPDQAIHGIEGQFEGLGETLCTVCFPDAPAEWCRTRSEVTRAEREAAKAARAEAKFTKNLRPAEAFRTVGGERIETVAAAKALIRKAAETAVELEWYRSADSARKFGNDAETQARYIRNAEAKLPGEQADARHANGILLAREAAAPGTGWTQADADKAAESAARRTRKAYFG